MSMLLCAFSRVASAILIPFKSRTSINKFCFSPTVFEIRKTFDEGFGNIFIPCDDVFIYGTATGGLTVSMSDNTRNFQSSLPDIKLCVRSIA